MMVKKLTLALLLNSGLTCMLGCQGVSSGPNNGDTSPGQLTVAPTNLAFGNVAVGSTGSTSATLTASGSDVTVTAASANNALFAVSGPSLPVKIPAGQSASFSVTFSPQASGTASGTLSFTSNAQTSVTTAPLSGTGIASSHTVTLSWDASTSSDVAGYDVYRAVSTGSCGSYTRINTSLETSTQYTDTSVVSGNSYCYAVTTVSTSNQESDYSNIAVVTL
jgi:hypothetical protein